jgi:hypothetical protein
MSDETVQRLDRVLAEGIGEHQVMAMIRRYANEQRWSGQGVYYAWGRMDGGDSPVVTFVPGAVANAADTAYAFGDLYVAMMRDFTERRRVAAIGLPSAWENFRVSGGTTLEYPRAEQPADLTV